MRKVGLFILLLFLFGLIGYKYVSDYMESSKIKENSTLVEAVLVESNNCYIEQTDKDDYYDVRVYQHLVVEYELDGETCKTDMGTVKIDESSSRHKLIGSEVSERENSVKYQVGDSIEVYVDQEGTAHLASEIDSKSDSSKLVVAGSVIGITLLLVAPIFFRRKRRA